MQLPSVRAITIAETAKHSCWSSGILKTPKTKGIIIAGSAGSDMLMT